MAFKLNIVLLQCMLLKIVGITYGDTDADCPPCFDMLQKLFRLENDQRNLMDKLEEHNNAIVALRQNATACLPQINHMYLGCYVDSADRLLEGGHLNSNNMTTKMCLDFCLSNGMRYFLTEAKSDCFCGNSLKGYDKRPDSECNYVCAGDSNENCGGVWRGSLYDIATASKIATKPSLSFVYLGCYEDSGDRLLKEANIVSTNMTSKWCFEVCVNKGMRYFVTEYTSECFCGNKLVSDLATRARSDSECDHVCSGDNAEKCGGYWRGSVYNITGTVASKPSVSFVYLGCYEDSGDRLFKEANTVSTNMTSKWCFEFCVSRGMRYFVTEFTSECFCGNKLVADLANRARSDSECDHVCSGDNAEKCGGYWRGSVYNITGTVASKPSVSFVYLGCYEDSGDRLLKEAITVSSNMTSKWCFEFCVSKGMRYFVTEYTSECFCGNQLVADLANRSRTDSECDHACSGDTTEKCGGYWRGSVYNITRTVAP